ncbi:MAG: 50S ribosomal protein L21 [Candidatus Dojkabacteria bacterium]
MAETKKKTTTTKKSQTEKKSASSSKKATTKTNVAKAPKTAILEINNMQYVVAEGETISTRIATNLTDKDLRVNLLAIIDGENFEYGKPYLKQKVEFSLGNIIKGEKVTTNKFKAKSRYRKKTGFRPRFVEFTLNSIK